MYDTSPDYPDSPDTVENTAEEAVETAEAVAEPRQRRARRHLLPFEINWPTMLLIVLLIALTAFILLLNQGAVPARILIWWPLAIVVPSALWFLISIIRRSARGMLASAALFGIGLSLLLATQGVAPFGVTVVGITFIAAGTGVMLRGLLLSNQPVG